MADLQLTEEERRVLLRITRKHLDQATCDIEDDFNDYIEGEKDWDFDTDEVCEFIAAEIDKAIEAIVEPF